MSTPFVENKDRISAVAMRLLQVWRKLDVLDELPLQPSDIREVEKQRQLIKVYMELLAEMQNGNVASVGLKIIKDAEVFAGTVLHTIEQSSVNV